MIIILSTNQLVLLSLGLSLLSLINTAPLTSVNTNNNNNSTTYDNISNNCNCTNNDDDTPICGSNGITFQSEYDLCIHNCEHNTSITIKDNKECRNCTTFAAQLQQVGANSGVSLDVIIRCSEGTQTLKDLISLPYMPSCQSGPERNHLFAPRQYNSMCRLYWCATPDGDPIKGTVSKDKIDCNGICVVNNNLTYKNKEIFNGECGVCQCIDGTITCIKDYCSDPSAKSLNTLKTDVMKLYVLQDQFSDIDAQIGLVYIRRQGIKIYESEINRLLEWKFAHYNKDNDDKLSPSDLSILYSEVYVLIRTKSFVKQLQEHIDTDSNGIVTKSEFKKFFTTS